MTGTFHNWFTCEPHFSVLFWPAVTCHVNLKLQARSVRRHTGKSTSPAASRWQRAKQEQVLLQRPLLLIRLAAAPAAQTNHRCRVQAVQTQMDQQMVAIQAAATKLNMPVSIMRIWGLGPMTGSVMVWYATSNNDSGMVECYTSCIQDTSTYHKMSWHDTALKLSFPHIHALPHGGGLLAA